jgi:hypothetical protein
VYSVLLVNMEWQREMTVDSALRWLAVRDPFLTALGTTGLVYVGAHMFERSRLLRGEFLLFTASASLAIGLFVIPVPSPNYLQALLPLLAVAGAILLVDIAERVAELSRRRGVGSVGSWTTIGVVCLLAVMLGLTLSIAKPRAFHDLFYPLVAIGAIASFAVLISLRAHDAALGVLLVALSVYSFQQLQWMATLSNAWQLNRIREVQVLTRPRDPVLDGWSGFGVFRPHAWRYFFVHPGIRHMLPPEEISRLVQRLENGEIAPRLIIFDRHLADLSQPLSAYVAKCYEPVDESSTLSTQARLLDHAAADDVTLLSRRNSCR